MSKQQLFNWSKVSAIVACIGVLPFIGAWVGRGVDIVRVPARETLTEQRLNELQTNCTAQFQNLNWKLDRLAAMLNNQ
jgi:hypothetical protein